MDTEKENKVSTLDGTVPSTPSGQVMLKRTRSMQIVKNGKRQPLASKDNNNNRSSSFLLQKNKLALNKKDSNVRKFKKYGSVLGYDTGSRVKSLVLKDIESGDESSEDDGEQDPLALKLKNALEKERSAEPESGKSASAGLLNGKKGLRQIFSDRDYDRDIEFAPEKPAGSEYIPEGVEPFTSEELRNLRRLSTPFDLHVTDNENDDSEEEPQAMKLIPTVTIGEEPEAEDSTLITKSNNFIDDDEEIIELEAEYNGKGLNEDELFDLLD